MAQRVNIVLVDDLDGTEAAETVSFGLDGKLYEIDLSAAHAKALRKSLEGYIKNGRVAKRARRSTAVSTLDTKAVRDWANTQGIVVSEKGRIPQSVVRQYQESQAS